MMNSLMKVTETVFQITKPNNMKKFYPWKSFFNIFLVMFAFSILILGTVKTHAQTTGDMDAEYYAKKLAQFESEMSITKMGQQPKQGAPLPAPAPPAPGCFIPLDGTYTVIARNDDGWTGPINLPFEFNLYGDKYDQVWINTNGNLSFTRASSWWGDIPNNSYPPMILGFGNDVKTSYGTSGSIYYKLSATNLIVTWDGVNRFAQSGPLVNTFQIIIGSTGDALTGSGTNVSFRYEDIQWGSNIIIGANKGDGIKFEKYDYGGDFNNLDNQCLYFNTSLLIDQCPSDINVNVDPGTCGALVNYALPTTNQGDCLNTTFITNGSFETGDYTGWTLSGGIGETFFGILEKDSTMTAGGTYHNYWTNTDDVIPGGGLLPYTAAPTNGNYMGVFYQLGPNSHRMYQDVTLPNGNVELSFDMQYYNSAPAFSATQYISVNIRSVVSDQLIKNLFKTLPGDAQSIPMTGFNFDLTAYAGQNVRVEILYADIIDAPLNIAFDNIRINKGLTMTQTTGLHPGSLFPVGTTTNTFVVTDACGTTETCSFDVTVTDNEAPVATAQDVIIVLDNNGNATATAALVNNASSDNCGIASMTLSKTNFDCSNIGANAVTLTVTDVNGNVSTANATVTVQDNIPLVAIAQNVTVQLDASGNGSTTAAAVDNGSFDNCGYTMALSKTNFTCADLGINAVTLTVTGINGTTATANANVTVVDNILPTVRTNNLFVNLDANGKASITKDLINNGSYDNCGISNISLSKTSFTCTDIGTNTVTLTVYDKSGNSNTQTASVTVRDNMSPILMLITDPIEIQRVDGQYVTFDIRELVDRVSDNADDCGAGNLKWSITKASSDEPEDAAGRDDGSTTNDIVITDDGQEIKLRAESSTLGNGRVYTIYIVAIDANGNRTEATCTVTVFSRGRYTPVNDGAVYWEFPGGFEAIVPPAAMASTMMQNTPNPFKSTTAITFTQDRDEYVSLAIYSMAGQLVKTLVSEVRAAGNHTIVWEADDDKGELVPPGMYIYILKTNEKQLSKKMLILK